MNNHQSKPSVSVVIPCFNSEQWINAAIDSVLCQNTLPNEIIVVNDGSTDRTQHIVESYGSRVILINQPNSGVSTARRVGVKYATADYIKFLDSDDLLPDGALRSMLEVASAFPGEAILGKCLAFEFNSGTSDERMYSLPSYPPHLGLIRRDFLLTQATNTGLWLLPRHLINNDTFFAPDVKLGEEYKFCKELIKTGVSIRFCDNFIYILRIHQTITRLSRTTEESDHLKQIELIKDSASFIQESIKDYTQESINYIAHLCWSRGRDCLRIGCQKAALGYFRLGKELTPNLRPVGGTSYKFICWITNPFIAERLMETFKNLLRRIMNQ